MIVLAMASGFGVVRTSPNELLFYSISRISNLPYITRFPRIRGREGPGVRDFFPFGCWLRIGLDSSFAAICFDRSDEGGKRDDRRVVTSPSSHPVTCSSSGSRSCWQQKAGSDSYIGGDGE